MELVFRVRDKTAVKSELLIKFEKMQSKMNSTNTTIKVRTGF